MLSTVLLEESGVAGVGGDIEAGGSVITTPFDNGSDGEDTNSHQMHTTDSAVAKNAWVSHRIFCSLACQLLLQP